MKDDFAKKLEELTEQNAVTPKERKVKLGGYLRVYRERSGVSVRKLAQLMGVAHTTLSRIERGEHMPKLERIETIVTALKLSGEDRDIVLELAGFQIKADGSLPEKSKLWHDYDFLTQLYEDARRLFEAGDYNKSRLYLTKIVKELHGSDQKDFQALYAKASTDLSRVLNLQNEPGKAIYAAHEGQKAARLTNNFKLDLEATHAVAHALHKINLDSNALMSYDWVWERMDRRNYPQLHLSSLYRDVASAMINMREFEGANELIKEALKIAEKYNSLSGQVNLRELWTRSLATEFRVRQAKGEIYSLYDWTQSFSTSSLEKIRILVILFKVHALQGDSNKSEEFFQQILQVMEQSKLYGQIKCLRSIAREVVIYRSDHSWLNRLEKLNPSNVGSGIPLVH
jgi:transcriptional regulator with XRE-family HTH domain